MISKLEIKSQNVFGFDIIRSWLCYLAMLCSFKNYVWITAKRLIAWCIIQQLLLPSVFTRKHRVPIYKNFVKLGDSTHIIRRDLIISFIFENKLIFKLFKTISFEINWLMPFKKYLYENWENFWNGNWHITLVFCRHPGWKKFERSLNCF